MEFRGKVVWITGASSGIGEAFAVYCADRGARLILSARRIAELERVAARCKGAENCSLLPFDLADPLAVEEACNAIQSLTKTLDVLVNNGGISQRGSAADTDEQVLRRLFEINFFSNVRIARCALSFFHMQSEGGSIVVMSSLAGKFGFYKRSGYSSSKHALHGFYEALRLEERKKNVRVLMVCPGYIRTSISVNAVDEKGKQHGKMDENQAFGLSPDRVPKKSFEALDKGKREILIGGKETLPVLIKRFMPALFHRIMIGLDPDKGTR